MIDANKDQSKRYGHRLRPIIPQAIYGLTQVPLSHFLFIEQMAKKSIDTSTP